MNEHKPWLKFYDPELPPNLDYEYRPLFEFLDQAAERWPGRTALVFKNYRITYKKLKVLSEIVAANLRARGVRPGDKVAIMMPNLPQTVISYWGVLRAGAVVVMTNPLYMETEIVHQLNDSGAKFMLLLDLLWPKIDALRDRLPVDAYFITSIDEGLRFPLSLLYRIKTKRDGQDPGHRLRRHHGAALEHPHQGQQEVHLQGHHPHPGHGPLAVHRRHHGRGQGLRHHPRQPGRQHAAVPGLSPGRRRRP